MLGTRERSTLGWARCTSAWYCPDIETALHQADGAAGFELPASALEIAALLRRRALSSYELVRHHLDVVARRNPDLGSFVEVRAERALAAARRADAQLARGGEVP